MIAQVASGGPIETVDEAVRFACSLGVLHYATCVNAVVFALLAAVLFPGMRSWCSRTHEALAAVGAACVPICATLNVFVYGSQITILPLLAASLTDAEGSAAATLVSVVPSVW